MSQAPSPAEDLTPETIASYLEEARTKFLSSLDASVLSGMQETDRSLTSILLLLRRTIEEGSKELAISRELFFLVSKGQLTQEKWQELVVRRAALTSPAAAVPTPTPLTP